MGYIGSNPFSVRTAKRAAGSRNGGMHAGIPENRFRLLCPSERLSSGARTDLRRRRRGGNVALVRIRGFELRFSVERDNIVRRGYSELRRMQRNAGLLEMQVRICFAGRQVRGTGRLYVKLRGMRFVGRLREMRRRLCFEKRFLRGQAENANRVLPARQDADR